MCVGHTDCQSVWSYGFPFRMYHTDRIVNMYMFNAVKQKQRQTQETMYSW